jgi:uncharacterized membrane protein
MLRALRHLFASQLGTRRWFSREVTEAIELAIAKAELRTSGEIRFAVETDLELWELRAGKPPRERALEVFGELRVWDSELSNGVLIYVLMADRDVEIVADRGAAACIRGEDWESACKAMEERFRAGRFQEGAVAGVAAVGALLERHFPARAVERNEQPNQPSLL